MPVRARFDQAVGSSTREEIRREAFGLLLEWFEQRTRVDFISPRRFRSVSSPVIGTSFARQWPVWFPATSAWAIATDQWGC